MKKNRILEKLVRPKGLGAKLNQHASVFDHKATKRNRSRGDKKRKAISDSVTDE